jgi:hypothetical protein
MAGIHPAEWPAVVRPNDRQPSDQMTGGRSAKWPGRPGPRHPRGSTQPVTVVPARCGRTVAGQRAARVVRLGMLGAWLSRSTRHGGCRPSIRCARSASTGRAARPDGSIWAAGSVSGCARSMGARSSARGEAGGTSCSHCSGCGQLMAACEGPVAGAERSPGGRTQRAAHPSPPARLLLLAGPARGGRGHVPRRTAPERGDQPAPQPPSRRPRHCPQRPHHAPLAQRPSVDEPCRRAAGVRSDRDEAGSDRLRPHPAN